MNEYLVVYEDAGPNWSAYVPDLPGCITTGISPAECKENIREAIELFIESYREMGKPVPVPSSQADYVKVA